VTPKQKADLEAWILSAQLNLKQGYPKVAAVQLEAALQALEVIDSTQAVGEPITRKDLELLARTAYDYSTDSGTTCRLIDRLCERLTAPTTTGSAPGAPHVHVAGGLVVTSGPTIADAMAAEGREVK
jgi:hypothetical protein